MYNSFNNMWNWDYIQLQIPADRCDHSANIGVSVPV